MCIRDRSRASGSACRLYQAHQGLAKVPGGVCWSDGHLMEVVMMGGYGYGNGWMWIWPLLVLVGLVILGVVAVRMTQGRSSGGPGAPASTARQVLDDRY